MEFLDRHDEMRRLDGALQRPGAFAVIWGRRRVGKSRLLIEWTRRHGGLYIDAGTVMAVLKDGGVGQGPGPGSGSGPEGSSRP